MKQIFLALLLLLFIQCEMLPSKYPVYGPGSTTSTSSGEKQEFADLLAKDQINKKHVTAEVLTYLLNEPDPSDKNTAAVIENASECNLILRVVGITNNHIYNLPVSARTKNQFVLQKGSYTFKSTICGAKYYSQKVLSAPLILKLSAQ